MILWETNVGDGSLVVVIRNHKRVPLAKFNASGVSVKEKYWESYLILFENT
jgi:hypothetical protein